MFDRGLNTTLRGNIVFLNKNNFNDIFVSPRAAKNINPLMPRVH